VKQSKISAAVREPMLSAGQVDAVTGFSYLSAVNLRDRGVPADDLAVLRNCRLRLRGLRLRGDRQSGIRRRKPEAVKGFLRAVIGGTHLAIKEPGARWMKSSTGWTADRAISSWSACAPDLATTS
jgi:NitT/TauT family transport system substrate-binding protein